MSAVRGAAAAGRDAGLPWTDVVMSAVAAVSWALIGMAGTAALGLRLLDADAAGSLAPMTAAVVALAVGGSVTPSGEVSAFGLSGVEAGTAIDLAPLGVGLVGALLLSFFFLRSLRAAGVVVPGRELLARAGAVVALFVATAGGLVWAGHDVITVDGGSLGLDDLPGPDGGGLDVPGLGDVEGLLPDRVGDLVDARAAVEFTVDTVPTLLGGLGWSAGVLLVALLASRRAPLPRGWDAVHRVVRPAVSSVVAVLLVAVAAGAAAAGYAAIGDDHPRRIAGAALLGAPNGVWLGVPVGLFVPWDARADGALLGVLPHPVDDLLRTGSEEPVTLGRLAELDGRVWLLGVAAALMLLLAGVLTALVRTPVSAASVPAASVSSERRVGAGGFARRCGSALGVATAVTLPLLVWLTEVSANASLSVLGFDAFDAGLELRGHLGAAALLGALWGAGAGAAGALLAWASGAAGARAAAAARGAGSEGGGGSGSVPSAAGPYEPGAPYRAPDPDTNPYLRLPGGRSGWREPAGTGLRSGAGEPAGTDRGSGTGKPEGTDRRSGTGKPEGPDRRSGTGKPEGTDRRSGTGKPEGTDRRSGTGKPEGTDRRSGTGKPEGTDRRSGAGKPEGPDRGSGTGEPEDAVPGSGWDGAGGREGPGGDTTQGAPRSPGAHEGGGADDLSAAPTVIGPAPPPGRGGRRLWPDEVPPPPPPPPPTLPPRPRRPGAQGTGTQGADHHDPDEPERHGKDGDGKEPGRQ
ncbi:streptophobe family protein [Streptomyces sp. Vc74B-19]|uniref:streptophobe family protein n=1 Tax=Streptomyces sp. Vc74B-19 TaxID=2741324 RepID=UPI0020413F45|nr:streptophobe family protein [Streptomyces sp. Vc74B-19]